MTEFKYEIKNKEVTIAGVNGEPTNVIIPAEIEGYPVTSIGYKAFYGCSSLKSIGLPESVTKIGSRAFEKCKNLQAIEIPKKIREIHSDTFYECNSLEFVKLPQKLLHISDRAFYNCPIKRVEWNTPNNNCWINCTSGLPMHRCIDKNWRQN